MVLMWGDVGGHGHDVGGHGHDVGGHGHDVGRHGSDVCHERCNHSLVPILHEIDITHALQRHIFFTRDIYYFSLSLFKT